MYINTPMVCTWRPSKIVNFMYIRAFKNGFEPFLRNACMYHKANQHFAPQQSLFVANIACAVINQQGQRWLLITFLVIPALPGAFLVIPVLRPGFLLHWMMYTVSHARPS